MRRLGVTQTSNTRRCNTRNGSGNSAKRSTKIPHLWKTFFTRCECGTLRAQCQWSISFELLRVTCQIASLTIQTFATFLNCSNNCFWNQAIICSTIQAYNYSVLYSSAISNVTFFVVIMIFVPLSHCLSHALIISLRVFFGFVLCLVISEVVFTDVRQYYRTVSCIISCNNLGLFLQSVTSG